MSGSVTAEPLVTGSATKEGLILTPKSLLALIGAVGALVAGGGVVARATGPTADAPPPDSCKVALARLEARVYELEKAWPRIEGVMALLMTRTANMCEVKP